VAPGEAGVAQDLIEEARAFLLMVDPKTGYLAD
jgi:hypothetical protein